MAARQERARRRGASRRRAAATGRASKTATVAGARAGRDGPGGRRRVRYAVVGLGYISQAAVLPAFAHAARNSELVALVSGDPEKLRKLGRRYGVERLWSYDEYDACLARGEVDAAFIALPNHLHREYTVRTARAGVHVLCEKPMAMTERDCEAMIAETDRNGVKLMIAYRLHFEEANLRAVDLVQAGKIGEPRVFSSLFTMQVKDEDNIRLQVEGGGPLYDVGIYCLNAARALFCAEPIEAFARSARSKGRRFREVDEMLSAVLRFPDERLAAFTCSFGASDVSAYHVIGTEGNLRVDPAYEFAGALAYELTVGERARKRTFPKRDQFAPELLHFSDCVLTGVDPEPSGREGLADVRVLRALARSARTGRPVRLGAFRRRRRPDLSQEIRRPAVEKPKLVRAETPSGDS